MKNSITVKNRSNCLIAIAFLAVMAFVAGCGDVSSSTGSSVGSSTIGGSGMIVAGVGTGGTGVVTSASADSYVAPVLVGAIVFMDKNGNRQPDADEPSVLTDSDGNYTMPSDAGATTGTLLMQAVAGSTIVKATGQMVTESYIVEIQLK